MSLPVLETSRSRPSSMNASARTPSHFISTAQSAEVAGGRRARRWRASASATRAAGAARGGSSSSCRRSANSDVAAGQPLAVQDDLDLAFVPLENLVGAVIPDRDASRRRTRRAGSRRGISAYSSGWSSVCTARWFTAWVVGDALGQRPRHEHPVAFQPEVPVQPPRVMLLHDEDPAGGAARPARLAPSPAGPPGRARACAPDRACPGTPPACPRLVGTRAAGNAYRGTRLPASRARRGSLPAVARRVGVVPDHLPSPSGRSKIDWTATRPGPISRTKMLR